MEYYISEGIESMAERFLNRLPKHKQSELLDETTTFLQEYQIEEDELTELRTELRIQYFYRNMKIFQATGLAYPTTESYETILLPVHPVLQIAFLATIAKSLGEISNRVVSQACRVSMRETYYWNISAMCQLLEVIQGRVDVSYAFHFPVCIRPVKEKPLDNLRFGGFPVAFCPFDFIVACEIAVHFAHWITLPLPKRCCWTANGRLKDVPEDSPDWALARQFINSVQSSTPSDHPLFIQWPDIIQSTPSQSFLNRIIRTRLLLWRMQQVERPTRWDVV